MPPAQEPTGASRLTQVLVDLTDVLVGDFDVIDVLTSVTDRCLDVLDASTARVVLVAPDGDVRAIARSGDAPPTLELIELQSGEGPGWDCIRTGRPVVNRHLAEIGGRFAPAALDAGYHSAHAVPLRLRGTTFGALSFLRVDRAMLDAGDVVAAQALADVAVLAILQHSVALEDVDQQLNDALDSQVLIEQAANMLAERAGLDVEPAFQRLRNHARSSRFRLVDVAVDVMSGSLPSTVDAPLVRRRASDAPVRLADSPTASQVATKTTVEVVSRAIEDIAAAAGADATVIALFQRGPYLLPRLETYTALATAGATVVVAYAGDGPTVPGATHVGLDDDEDLTQVWGLIVMTPTSAAFVVGHDRQVLDPSGPTLEGRRQFAASWGFDREGACAHARVLFDGLGGRLASSVRETVADAITLAEATPTPRAERSLAENALVITARLTDTQRRSVDAAALVAAGTPSPRRDPVTGLINADGLARWLGGPTLDAVPMPPLGAIVLELPGLDGIEQQHGRTTANAVLSAVAETLLAGTRLGDVVVRWGPAQFLVLGASLAGSELALVAERLLAAVTALTVDGLTTEASVTTSMCTARPVTAADLHPGLDGRATA